MARIKQSRKAPPPTPKATAAEAARLLETLSAGHITDVCTDSAGNLTIVAGGKRIDMTDKEFVDTMWNKLTPGQCVTVVGASECAYAALLRALLVDDVRWDAVATVARVFDDEPPAT